MSPCGQTFLIKLRERVGNGVRVAAADYREVFAEVRPTLDAGEFRIQLAALFEELEADGSVSLPRSKRLYDHAGAAKLPAWIDLIKKTSATEPLPVEPATYPWAPELRFACGIRDARQLEVLLRIQNFLVGGGRTRPMVPAKERSVELFGEEKRLERLRTGPLFGEGRITLDLLRCFVVLPPLVFEALPSGGAPLPILVLENYSTYHSFARWNEVARAYVGIFYGNGDTFEMASAGLVDVKQRLNWEGRAFYFGDLDVKGVLIPVAASETLEAQGFPKLRPHAGCYRRLLERGRTGDLPINDPTKLPRNCIEWLGESLAGETDRWLSRGQRLPQELVGWEELSDSAQRFARPEAAVLEDRC
ncbi:MAG: hypothetical protein WA771_13300 [Chthoniobacterales bacterium]